MSIQQLLSSAIVGVNAVFLRITVLITIKQDMKARVKATGEIVTLRNLYTDGTARDVNGLCYYQSDISFIDKSKESINWEQRRYELAKEAMGALISSPSYQFCEVDNYYEVYIESSEDVAKDAMKYADALIEELKGGKK